MRRKSVWTVPMLLILAALAVTPTVADQNPTGQQGTVFRVETNFVRTDVIVRDREGRFVPDLKVDEFRVYEDGVLQNITLFTPWVGGRALGNLASPSGGPAQPVVEGLVLPAARQQQDSSGRLFIIFIDDRHLRATETPRVREVLRMVRDLLIHDNDLVGFVSTGTSAIQIDPTYDYGHRRFNEAISKVMGSAPSPDEIIQDAIWESSQGPRDLRHAAHVSFQTAYDLLEQLASVTERRKAFVYVSGGYHFNPFQEARLQRIKDYYAMWHGNPDEDSNDNNDNQDDPNSLDSFLEEDYRRRTAFTEADLISEIAQLTRAAQRSNVTFYTVDPRGLVAHGGDASIRTQISHTDLRDFTATQVSTLRVLAEETGGFAIVETNDFEKGIRRIDSETSDFYQIGYVSTNPDPTKIRRVIKVEITRPDLQEPIYRSEYTIPRPRRR